MDIKIALLAIHTSFLIFLLTRPLILRPKKIFGEGLIDRDDDVNTVLEYDSFEDNSSNFRRFYLSSLFIKLVFYGFIFSMIITASALIGDFYSVNSPSSVTNWTSTNQTRTLTVTEGKLKKIIAQGPLNSAFFIAEDGTVFPVKNEKNRLMFIILDKNGLQVINTRNVGDVFGVVALLLAIACVVLWIVHRKES